MAKTRLNNDDRNVIAAAIIAHKFDPLIAMSRATEVALAGQAYDRLYPAEVKRKMRALPEGSFKMVDDLIVSVNGQKFTLHLCQDSHDELGANPVVKDRAKRELRPVLYKHAERAYYTVPPLLLMDSDDLGAAIVTWAHEREDLKQDPAKMRQKLDATLAQFRYFDDLITEFPQAEAFILKRWRDRPEGGSPGVPAVVIKDLARELDLPPETQALAA